MNRIDLEQYSEKMKEDLIMRKADPEELVGKALEQYSNNLSALKADLRHTQEKLQQLKINFDRAFAACPTALAITRMADGKFLEINTAYTRIMGYQPDEILGRTPADMDIYVNPQERNLLLQRYQEQGYVRDYTLHMRNKSGEIRTLQVSMEPIAYDKEQEPTLIYAFVDLTESKQMRAELEDINTALNVMLEKKERDNQILEEMLKKKIAAGYESLILPLLGNLRNTISNKNQLLIMDMLEKNFEEVFSSFGHKLSAPLLNLTPAEIQIAAMIKQGMTNKQIAQTLHNSIRTIDAHRASIRRKLQIQNKKINLRAYLSNL